VVVHSSLLLSCRIRYVLCLGFSAVAVPSSLLLSCPICYVLCCCFFHGGVSFCLLLSWVLGVVLCLCFPTVVVHSVFFSLAVYVLFCVRVFPRWWCLLYSYTTSLPSAPSALQVFFIYSHHFLSHNIQPGLAESQSNSSFIFTTPSLPPFPD
jgi:hypothetical protein